MRFLYNHKQVALIYFPWQHMQYIQFMCYNFRKEISKPSIKHLSHHHNIHLSSHNLDLKFFQHLNKKYNYQHLNHRQNIYKNKLGILLSYQKNQRCIHNLELLLCFLCQYKCCKEYLMYSFHKDIHTISRQNLLSFSKRYLNSYNLEYLFLLFQWKSKIGNLLRNLHKFNIKNYNYCKYQQQN